MKVALTEEEQNSCKLLCKEKNMAYKGGNDFTSKLGGCKVCYCETAIPLICSD